jgi:hypothetical protein
MLRDVKVKVHRRSGKSRAVVAVPGVGKAAASGTDARRDAGRKRRQ